MRRSTGGPGPRVVEVGAGWSRRWGRCRRVRSALLGVFIAGLLGLAAIALSGCGPAPVVAQPVPSLALSETSAGGLHRSLQTYALPQVPPLQASDGRVQRLDEALFDGRAVVLTFMFSSCATVCPVSNQTLVALEESLGSDRGRVRTVSLSIDPDHDTVREMAAYARRSGRVGAFYTSDPGTSEAVQKAFDVWRGDKMAHPQVFLIGTGPDRPWVRLEGAASPRELLDELRRLGVLPG